LTPSEDRLAQYAIANGVAVLTIDHPPVNALSHVVRIALMRGVERALADPAAQALVLICRGRTFFAGADVKELGRPIEPPLLADVMRGFEASPKPIVSALHGTALGGGFELALAGHFRVAVPSAVVGLPEVALGLLPGAGGTQRVPRLVGVRAAVDFIGLGRHVRAAEALELGLIDAIVEEADLEAGAVAFAREAIDRGLPLRRVRDIDLAADEAELEDIFAAFRRDHPELFVGLKAAEGALAAIRAAATLPFDQGIVREREIAQPLTASAESAAQRHLFFAERAVQKLPGSAAKARAPRGVRVAGAWRHGSALAPDDGTAEVLVVAGGDFAAVDEVSESAVLVAAGRESLADFRGAAARPDRVIGFAESHGIVEIGLGQPFDEESAALAMGTARALGLPAIFVTGDPAAGVIARMVARFGATAEALRRDGVSSADLAASMAGYGFVPARYGVDGSGGRASEPVLNRVVADLADEALTLQREGTVLRGSDIDFAMVKAGMWPLWRGGPAFVAEREGAETIAAWRGFPAPRA
jgi:3-hydroxyacyl-CoA dehydrogenase